MPKSWEKVGKKNKNSKNENKKIVQQPIKPAAANFRYKLPVPGELFPVMWINHRDLKSDASYLNVETSPNPGVLPYFYDDLWTKITCNNKAFLTSDDLTASVIVQVPDNRKVKAIRIVYYVSNSRSQISRLGLRQYFFDDDLRGENIILDEGEALNGTTQEVMSTFASSVDFYPSIGPLVLRIGVKFGDISDYVFIRALGVHYFQS